MYTQADILAKIHGTADFRSVACEGLSKVARMYTQADILALKYTALLTSFQ
jgi:hypothetical protein